MPTDWSNVPVTEGELVLGKYRIENVIGAGGMGVVVAATHLELSQKVAIKFLFPSAVGVPGAKERFLREARAAARLRSEHVTRVVDVGLLENGVPFMVMEYLEGCDLGQWLVEHGSLTIEEAVRCVLQATDAVSEAHALGIIHRDLKPSNLFLSRKHKGNGFVKVLDFGISKLKSLPGLEQNLTQTNDMVGSPNYMAPEQIRSAREVDERTDIWAFGVILYELLTAAVPFPAENIPQLCAMVLEKPPVPLLQHREGMPEVLEKIIYRCLEKDPARRYQNLDELSDALVAFSNSEPSFDKSRSATKAPLMLRNRLSETAAAPGSFAVSNAQKSASLKTQASPGVSRPSAPPAATSAFDRTLASQSTPMLDAKKSKFRWLAYVASVAGLLLIAAVVMLRLGFHRDPSVVASSEPVFSSPAPLSILASAGPSLTQPTSSALHDSPALSSSSSKTARKPPVSAPATGKPVAVTPSTKPDDPLLPSERK